MLKQTAVSQDTSLLRCLWVIHRSAECFEGKEDDQ